jgi:uncharacterized membrane protein
MNLIRPGKIQELIENGFNIDIGGTLGEGIDLVKQEIGQFAVYTIIYYLILMAAGFIPMAGVIIGPPLVAGFYLYIHKLRRQEPREFSDFFRGFDYFGQLVVQQLIIIGLILLVCIPLLAALVTSGFFISNFDLGNAQLGIVAMFSILLSTIGIIYISTIYLFAPFFILFGDYQAWDAMEASRKIVVNNFWTVFGLVILTALLIMAGALLCLVGLLFTIPAGYATFYIAFERLVDLNNPYSDSQDDILDHLVD